MHSGRLKRLQMLSRVMTKRAERFQGQVEGEDLTRAYTRWLALCVAARVGLELWERSPAVLGLIRAAVDVVDEVLTVSIYDEGASTEQPPCICPACQAQRRRQN